MTEYFTGNETTRRESLLDTISIRHLAETPLIRSLPSTKLTSTVTDYSVDVPFTSTDAVRSPSDPHQNTRMEGIDWIEDAANFPARLRSIAEINHFMGIISNSDREAVVAGMTDVFDYRAHQKVVKLLNNVENVLMYGTGSPTTSGASVGFSPAGDERRTQGLISWAAYTGTERVHGSATTLSDPYNISITSDFYSVFFDANGANLSRQMLYNRILAPFARAGGHVEGLLFHTGFKLKTLIADFAVRPDGSDVNTRNISASEQGTIDTIDWIKTPMGTIGFRNNRYLDIEGSTYTIDNRGPSVTFTPGSPTSQGTQNITAQADETLIGYEPGQVAIGWYRAPQLQMVPTAGDYIKFAAVAEFSLLVRHPLSVVGGCNLLG
jgi:hypothetical protein